METQTLVRSIEKPLLKTNLPTIRVGDQVKVGVLIREGEKERIQPYQGTVIAQHRAGLNSTITVRRTFQGIGVERIFLIHSPRISFIEVLRSSQVRRAKLYYLRERVGKQARLQERFLREPEVQ
uniref:Large ribosomal subunit protein bL19c n=1 Tax=Nephroselmis pyriformis TaxID=156128 RepID=A0A8A2H8K2_9CHLO|nr:ribosomal protein L19 [Nephroselmis pyriformis]QSV37255.1 ribosomal protein L19 [Nephroselmis pyriformis]